jgi:sulfhydrogenase subunit alpha
MHRWSLGSPGQHLRGRFYRWPDSAPLKSLLPELEWALEAAQAAVKWAITFPYPKLELEYDFVANHHPEEYGVINGEVWSSKGSHLPVSDYETSYIEEHIRHSNALHSRTTSGEHYLVGPLARLTLNHEQLLPLAKKALKDNKIKLSITNPYQSLIARAVELVHFCEEAIRLIQAYEPKGFARLTLKMKAGEGAGSSEAPRGLLYHRYKIDDQDRVQFAKITLPTAQNLSRIEEDLLALAPQIVKMPMEQATLTAEHLVRSYDPCISCATHILKLKIENEE